VGFKGIRFILLEVSNRICNWAVAKGGLKGVGSAPIIKDPDLICGLFLAVFKKGIILYL